MYLLYPMAANDVLNCRRGERLCVAVLLLGDARTFLPFFLHFILISGWRSSFRVSSFLAPARLQTEQPRGKRGGGRIRTQHHAARQGGPSRAAQTTAMPLNERTNGRRNGQDTAFHGSSLSMFPRPFVESAKEGRRHHWPWPPKR